MATSPLFGWEEPDDTDLVKDGAAAIRTLGNAIDTSMGDLLGGTTGQVLSKNSNTNMDFTWVTSDDANAIQNTIVDAKGDLIAASASDVPARLAVGANGETLIADSTAATGLKWAKSANFVGCSLFQSGAGTQSIANNVNTVLTFDSEVFDTDGFHSTSTNTSRITIPTGLGGKYRFNLNSLWEPNATNKRFIQLGKNGTGTYYGPDLPGVASYYIGYGLTFTVSAIAGDYFEFFAYQNYGGTLNIYKRETEVPFTCEYLGV